MVARAELIVLLPFQQAGGKDLGWRARGCRQRLGLRLPMPIFKEPLGKCSHSKIQSVTVVTGDGLPAGKPSRNHGGRLGATSVSADPVPSKPSGDGMRCRDAKVFFCEPRRGWVTMKGEPSVSNNRQ